MGQWKSQRSHLYQGDLRVSPQGTSLNFKQPESLFLRSRGCRVSAGWRRLPQFTESSLEDRQLVGSVAERPEWSQQLPLLPHPVGIHCALNWAPRNWKEATRRWHMALPGNPNMRLEGHPGRRKPHRVWFEPRDSEQQLSTNAVGAGRWGLQGAGPVLGFPSVLAWRTPHRGSMGGLSAHVELRETVLFRLNTSSHPSAYRK